MNGIREWAFSLCFVAVACGIMEMLVPSASIGKVFRFTVGVFFLICILSPVMMRSYTPPTITHENVQAQSQEIADKLTQSVNKRFNKESEQRLKRILTDNLSKSGIKTDKVIINISTKDKENIIISSVYIEADKHIEEKHDEIISITEKVLDITPKIVYTE